MIPGETNCNRETARGWEPRRTDLPRRPDCHKTMAIKRHGPRERKMPLRTQGFPGYPERNPGMPCNGGRADLAVRPSHAPRNDHKSRENFGVSLRSPILEDRSLHRRIGLVCCYRLLDFPPIPRFHRLD